MSDRKIILVGYSGHGIVVVDTAFENNLNIIGYTEKTLNFTNPFNLEYFGDESNLDFKWWDLDVDFVLGIGDNKLRETIYNKIIQKGKKVTTLINSSASISKYSTIGEGVFINRNVSVNAFAKIGNNVILNTSCVIEHDCEIQDNVHIAPSAVLAGNVKVGAGTFIGANAVIKQGVIIGKNVIIGAGSVVISDIPDKSIVYGSPAK